MQDLVNDLRAAVPDRPVVFQAPKPVMVARRLRVRRAGSPEPARERQPAHAPRTLVEVRVQRENGDVSIEVEDHGPGIDADVRNRLFERFLRDPLRSCATGGSGRGIL